MTRLEALNLLAASLRARTYLEIGVKRGDVLGLVRVPEKVGVDPDPTSAATHVQTSDAYFAGLSPAVRFDLIFVDGLHLAEQVRVDVANALRHLSTGGVVVVHDCDPPAEHYTSRVEVPGGWCGDVYRGWLALRPKLAARGYETFTVDADLGLGVVATITETSRPMLAPGFVPLTRQPLPDWSTFQARRREYLGLVSPEAFRRWARDLQALPGRA